MLAGGQIAGVSGLLPHCFQLKRNHNSWLTPQHDQPLLKNWVMKSSLVLIVWLKAGVSFAWLPVHPSGSQVMSKLFHGGMCLDIALSWHTLIVRTWHISYPFLVSLWGHTVARGLVGMSAAVIVLCRIEFSSCTGICVWTWHEHAYFHLCMAAWIFSWSSLPGFILVFPKGKLQYYFFCN